MKLKTRIILGFTMIILMPLLLFRPPGPKPGALAKLSHTPKDLFCVLSVTQELVYSKEKNMSTTFFIFLIIFLKLLPVGLKGLSGRHFIRICCNSVPIPV